MVFNYMGQLSEVICHAVLLMCFSFVIHNLIGTFRRVEWLQFSAQTKFIKTDIVNFLENNFEKNYSRRNPMGEVFIDINMPHNKSEMFPKQY